MRKAKRGEREDMTKNRKGGGFGDKGPTDRGVEWSDAETVEHWRSR